MRDDSLDDYDYELPPGLVAQRPAARRDGSRLLVHRRADASTTHTTMANLPAYLEDGDLLVVNDTRVIPARIRARKRTGARVEILLLQPRAEPGRWEALVRPSARVRPGSEVLAERGEVPIGVGAVLDEGHREVTLPPGVALDDLGEPPLPPYIRRPDGAGEDDRRRYQTIYAAVDGAVAAPTAGLHFTETLLDAVRRRGVETASLTLHVGAGTFEPVRAERLDDHRMHEERYRVPPTTVRAIERTAERGGRVLAVGTTVVRSLEAWAEAGRPDDGRWRRTVLFIRPGRPFAVVQGMLTNFHLPRSTLLMLVSAWTGRERLLSLYGEAIEAGYRFYSYGDATLLL